MSIGWRGFFRKFEKIGNIQGKRRALEANFGAEDGVNWDETLAFGSKKSMQTENIFRIV